jgi:hypothetical protein
VLASSGTVLATSTGLLLLVCRTARVVFAITVRSHETPSCAHSWKCRTSCATASGELCVNTPVVMCVRPGT